MNLDSKNVLVGVTGGIAAYKSAILVRSLKKANAEVRVVMTKAAQEFLTPLTMASLSENQVGLDMFQQPPIHEIRHISWADWSELAILAPATANIIGKAANGIADDLLSSLLLALECPVVFAPAMHRQMWAHPAVQRNIETLRSYGYHIVEPVAGELASGDMGVGRMSEPDEILQFIQDL